MSSYKALKSFVGLYNARKGDNIEIESADVANDLIKRGFIEANEPETKPAQEITATTPAKRGRKPKTTKEEV